MVSNDWITPLFYPCGFEDFLKTFWGLFEDFLRTFWRLFEIFLKTFWRLFNANNDQHQHSHANNDQQQENHTNNDQNQNESDQFNVFNNKDYREKQHEKSYQDLDPVNEPSVKRVNNVHSYIEESHLSPAGQRYTVRTRDTHL